MIPPPTIISVIQIVSDSLHGIFVLSAYAAPIDLPHGDDKTQNDL
jgi:hypothetical protein